MRDSAPAHVHLHTTLARLFAPTRSSPKRRPTGVQVIFNIGHAALRALGTVRQILDLAIQNDAAHISVFVCGNNSHDEPWEGVDNNMPLVIYRMITINS